MLFKATRYKIITGIGTGKTELNAFDNALQKAGVGNYNLLKVSSVLPPNAVSVEKIDVPHGSVLPIAYSSKCTSKKGDQITASIAVGIPENENIGIIMEYSTNGESTLDEVKQHVSEMVREAMDNRKIVVQRIECEAVQTEVTENYCCVFAALALF